MQKAGAFPSGTGGHGSTRSSPQACGAGTAGLTIVVLAAVGVSLARALRTPNDYSEAYWLVDYRFGFVRRGLIGSVAGLLGAPDPARIAAASFVLLAVSVLALSWVVWRILARWSDRSEAFLLVAVFATSPYLVMSGHLVGYYDNVLATVAVVAAWLAVRRRWWLAGIAGVVAMLVHESFIVFGYPLILLGAYLSLDAPGRPAPRLGEALPLLLPAVAFGALSLHQALILDAEPVYAGFKARMIEGGFVHPGHAELAARTLTITFVESLRQQRYYLVQRLTDARTMLAVLPSVAALVFVGARRLRAEARLLEALAIGAVVGLPLALLAVAYDTERIWSRLVFNALAAAWLLGEARPFTPARLRAWTRAALVAVAVANAFSRIQLMDEEVERFGSPALVALYAPLFVCALWFLLRPSPPAAEVAP